MNKKLKTRIIAVTSALALSASLFAAFGSSFNFENLMRAKSSSSTIENGTITFNGSNTTRASYTYTTVSETAGGNYIKSVGTNNGLNENGVVAYFAYDVSDLNFRDNSNNPFNFSGSILKSVALTKTEWGTFSIKYAYKCSGDSDYTYSSAIDLIQSKEHVIELGELSDVVEFKLVNASSNTGKFSKVVITYDCGPGIGKQLSSISISGDPSKTAYNDGENFNPSGMTVLATYNNSDVEDVTNKCTFSPTPLVVGTTSVEITYTYKGVSKSAIYNGIVVEEGGETTKLSDLLKSQSYVLTGVLSGFTTYNYVATFTFGNNSEGSVEFKKYYGTDHSDLRDTYTQTFTYSVDDINNTLSFLTVGSVSTASNMRLKLTGSYRPNPSITVANDAISSMTITVCNNGSTSYIDLSYTA